MKYNFVSVGTTIIALVAAFVAVRALFILASFIFTDSLCDAARRGNLADMAIAISWGAEVNGRGMHAKTPLMAACEGGQLECARYLIGLGADVNGHNDSGSALMWAVESGNVALCQLLCEQGVDVEWKNHEGSNVIDFAISKKNHEVVDLLKRFSYRDSRVDPVVDDSKQ